MQATKGLPQLLPRSHSSQSKLEPLQSTTPEHNLKTPLLVMSSFNYTPDPEKPAPDPRHLALALHHANQIQRRKDIESRIWTNIELLLSIPGEEPVPPNTPQTAIPSPSSSDIALVKRSLPIFQPVDFDNMILERNIARRCGYPLCPRQNYKEKPLRSSPRWQTPRTKPTYGFGRDGNIVEKSSTEKWCEESIKLERQNRQAQAKRRRSLASPDATSLSSAAPDAIVASCEEKASFLRKQLSEGPAWLRSEFRSGKSGREIVTWEEVREVERGGGVQALDAILTDLEIDGKKASAAVLDRHMADLALERGDSSTGPGADGRVDVLIREKLNGTENDGLGSASTRKGARAPEMGDDAMDGGSIEGYRPGNRMVKKEMMMMPERRSEGEGDGGYADVEMDMRMSDDEDDEDILPTI